MPIDLKSFLPFKPKYLPTMILNYKVVIFKMVVTALLFLNLSSSSYADAVVQKQIRNDIKTSQKEINQQQSTYTKQLADINKRLQAKSVSVEALRKKVAAATRATDESSLSIDALRSRVKKWNDQHSYQKHLLLSFFNQYPELLKQHSPADTENFTASLDGVKQTFSSINVAMYPAWKEQEIVDAHGTVINAQTLTLGPSHWYLDGNNGGLLKHGNQGKLVVGIDFTAGAVQELQDLQKKEKGKILLDPTLNKVQQYNAQQESVLSHVEKGGIWVIPIFAFAFFALLIAIFKTIQFWRLPKILPLVPERVTNVLARRHTDSNHQEIKTELQSIYSSTAGAQKELLKIAMETSSPAERDDLLVSCLLENKHALEKYLGVIAITAAVAPLLGLLGTVSGMIETFKMMTIFGTGDPAVVSGGISEALVTTELGLVVAIPALVINAILLRRIKGYTHLLETMAIKLSKIDMPVKSKPQAQSKSIDKE